MNLNYSLNLNKVKSPKRRDHKSLDITFVPLTGLVSLCYKDLPLSDFLVELCRHIAPSNESASVSNKCTLIKLIIISSNIGWPLVELKQKSGPSIKVNLIQRDAQD